MSNKCDIYLKYKLLKSLTKTENRQLSLAFPKNNACKPFEAHDLKTLAERFHCKSLISLLLWHSGTLGTLSLGIGNWPLWSPDHGRKLAWLIVASLIFFTLVINFSLFFSSFI